ncbi:MAG: hypothetical protein GC168_11605 [Candidatus Hydrogenedens sp.]|nr:hypothetical protein [Candidatus Hydrogenedens sp.]
MKYAALLLASAMAALAWPAAAAPHSADTDTNFVLDLSELLGVIQLYNAGAYQCDLEHPGDYLPGNGDGNCAAHASDYAPEDRRVSLSEVLRSVQFYNVGAYHEDCLGEDGYAPGPGAPENCGGPLFPDANLAAAVRTAIGKPSGDLEPSDVAVPEFSRLDAALADIGDITGLEHCTSLTELDLHGNCIADIAPLAGLVALRSLNLHDNQISDITALESLTGLDLLWLGRNAIDDISPLADNPGLAGTAGTGPWDRINLTFNPLGDASNAAALDTLASRGAFVWTNDGATAGKHASAPRTLRLHLRSEDGRAALVEAAEFDGACPMPPRGTGDHGTLRIWTEEGCHMDAALTFDHTETVCDHGVDGGWAGEENYHGAVDRVLNLPLTGNVSAVGYRTSDDAPFEPLPLPKFAKGGGCTPAEMPGDPIPVGAKLIHGDPALPDDRAYVLLLMGDAFIEENLGDPNLVEGVHNTSFIPYSQAMADSMQFLFSNEPFKEYADLFKVYRIDLISRDDEPTDLRENPPIVRDTALGMGRQSVGFDYDMARAYRVANNTGIPWDRIVLFPNGTGSGTQTADFIVYSGLQNSRRMTALHEFGHGIGLLADEYEYRHGTNPPASLPPDDVVEPNTVATGLTIPLLEEIPWRHWLADDTDCSTGQLGSAVDFDCTTDDVTECQCGPVPEMPGDCVPLPTCEPGGDFIDVDGKIYGRTEWPEPVAEDSPVGLFEGAKYRQKGAYRAELRCRMRSDDDVYPGDAETPRFCTVCRESLVTQFILHAGLITGASPDPGEPLLLANDTGIIGLEVALAAFATHAPEIVSWAVDDVVQPGTPGAVFQLDAQTLTAGVAHSIVMTLRDPTPWVHPEFEAGQEAVTQTITWTVTRAAK